MLIQPLETNEGVHKVLLKAVVCVTWSLSDCCLPLFRKTNHRETNSRLDTLFPSHVKLVENKVLMVSGA